MKKQLNIKKLILLNLPYILMGLFSTNFGEAWRMAVGADASAKMLSFFSTLPVALASWWPSLHPLDLLVGLCCGGGLRLAVYLKSKNAKKYRHGMEYGSARWGTHEDIAPTCTPDSSRSMSIGSHRFMKSRKTFDDTRNHGDSLRFCTKVSSLSTPISSNTLSIGTL
jgi:hypothetical protein